jgi:hypothetical protein
MMPDPLQASPVVGTVSFDRATFSGGTVYFYDATFSGGTADFNHATFSAAPWT